MYQTLRFASRWRMRCKLQFFQQTSPAFPWLMFRNVYNSWNIWEKRDYYWKSMQTKQESHMSSFCRTTQGGGGNKYRWLMLYVVVDVTYICNYQVALQRFDAVRLNHDLNEFWKKGLVPEYIWLMTSHWSCFDWGFNSLLRYSTSVTYVVHINIPYAQFSPSGRPRN